MTPDWNEKFTLTAPENETIDMKNFSCMVVHGKGLDNIFQFFRVKFPEFDELVAEVIEEHFGDTDLFAIEYVGELDMFGLLAKDQRDNPLYSKDFHVYGFLDLLDSTIDQLKQ